MRVGALRLAIVGLLACGAGPANESRGDSGFQDPGFEQGGWAWASSGDPDELFEVTARVSRSGKRSGWLPLDSTLVPPSTPARGATARQDVRPDAFPERFTGFYRVERWQRPDDGAGLEVRVLVFSIGDPRTQEILRPEDPAAEPPPARVDSYGIVYRLVGKPPASEAERNVGRSWANLESLEAGPDAPDLESWVSFDLPLRSDFERVWGVVPEGYEKLRVLLQVLWLDRTPGSEIRADVYFDDLALVPAQE